MNLKDNLLNPNTWLRLLLVLVVYVIGMLSVFCCVALSTSQLLFILITGEKNTNLQSVAVMVGSYLQQISDYVTFASDILPWPWTEFPDDSREPETEDVVFVD